MLRCAECGTRRRVDPQTLKLYSREAWHFDMSYAGNDVPHDMTTPRLQCSALVDTSCDEEDDWSIAFHTAHDFSTLLNMSHEPVLLAPEPQDDTVSPRLLRFLSFSAHHTDADPARDSCSVVGCTQQFVGPTYKSHAHGFTFKKRGGHSVALAYNLCKKHHNLDL